MGFERVPTGLVLVSHSKTLLDVLRAMADQVAGDEVLMEIAGGNDDGQLGTSAGKLESALRPVLDEVLKTGLRAHARVAVDFLSGLLMTLQDRRVLALW